MLMVIPQYKKSAGYGFLWRGFLISSTARIGGTVVTPT